jgi:hypothetical protein
VNDATGAASDDRIDTIITVVKGVFAEREFLVDGMAMEEKLSGLAIGEVAAVVSAVADCERTFEGPDDVEILVEGDWLWRWLVEGHCA